MKKTLKFHPSVFSSTAGKSSLELFDKSVEAFENKKYQTSLNYLLDSIDPGIRRSQSNRQPGDYCIPHGPLLIQVKQDRDNLRISAPLVRLSSTEPIAMLRQAAALNFNDLDLTRLVLEDDRLYFRFTCPLAYSHPQKIRRIFEEICRTGQKYDYEFTDQFGVERIIEPHFTPYASEKVEYVYEMIGESCRECLVGIKYFEALRQFNDVWTLLRTTFLKIIYIARPQGKLLHTLEKAISDMDRNLSLAELNADGKDTLKQLQEKTLEEVAADLYFTESFITEKKRSNLQNLRESYETCYKQVSAWMESEDYRKVCLKIVHKLYESYYLNQMDEQLDALFVKVLQETSAQPWAIAAPALYQLLDNIMQARIRKNIPPAAA